MDPSKRNHGHHHAHSVFRTERIGNALLVTPKGDLVGVGQREVMIERRAVVAEFHAPAAEVVIFDLSGHRYFGSEFIAFLAHVARDAQQRNAKVALCGASPDMQQVLAVMNLDGLWTHYSTRAEAVKALVRIRRRDQLRRAAPKLALLLFVLLVFAGAALYRDWRGRAFERESYDAYLRIWDRIPECRMMGPSDPKLRLILRNSRERIEQICAELKSSRDIRRPVRRHLYYAGHDHLLPILEDPHNYHPDLEEGFLTEMEAAREHLMRRYTTGTTSTAD